MKPIFSDEAERAVLGSILLNNKAFHTVAPLLNSWDFYTPQHRKVYDAIESVISGGSVADSITVSEVLEGKRTDNMLALSAFVDGVATTANVEYHAKIVSNHSAVRTMITAAEGIAADGYSGVDDVADYLADARGRIIQAGQSRAALQGLMPLNTDIGQLVENLGSGKQSDGLIKTGFADIDNLTGGFWPGLLTVIAARPGMGKSTFLTNFAINSGLRGDKGAIFTLEDKLTSIQHTVLGRLADINTHKLRLGKLEHDDLKRVMNALETMNSMDGIYVSDMPMNIRQIQQAAAAHKSINGLDWFAVDHLGYVSEDGKEYEVNSKITRQMAILAKELNVPGILLAQLNRKLEDRNDPRPRMADLRGSGRIEEDARAIYFIHRPNKDGNDPQYENMMEVNVIKQSAGPTGAVALWFDKTRGYVRDYEHGTAPDFKVY